MCLEKVCTGRTGAASRRPSRISAEHRIGHGPKIKPIHTAGGKPAYLGPLQNSKSEKKLETHDSTNVITIYATRHIESINPAHCLSTPRLPPLPSRESSLERPEGWVIKPSERWLKQSNDKGLVYYLDLETGESHWFPPCEQCYKVSGPSRTNIFQSATGRGVADVPCS